MGSPGEKRCSRPQDSATSKEKKEKGPGTGPMGGLACLTAPISRKRASRVPAPKKERGHGSAPSGSGRRGALAQRMFGERKKESTPRAGGKGDTYCPLFRWGKKGRSCFTLRKKRKRTQGKSWNSAHSSPHGKGTLFQHLGEGGRGSGATTERDHFLHHADLEKKKRDLQVLTHDEKKGEGGVISATRNGWAFVFSLPTEKGKSA